MSVITISDGSFSKTVNTDQPPKAKRPYHWRKARRPKAKLRQAARERMCKGAVVSQTTIDRLYTEALNQPAFEGMESGEVRAFVNMKLDAFLCCMPWWFGATPGGDARHRSNHRLHDSRREAEAAA